MKAKTMGRRLLLQVVLKLMFSVAILGALWVLFAAAFQRPESPRLSPLWQSLKDLPAGQMKFVQWQQHRVLILHRTPQMLADLKKTHQLLKRPDSVGERTGLYSVLFAIGELNCPVSYRVADGTAFLGRSWPGGFVDLCDGSRYDVAGRVFKEQAADDDLRLPAYRFEKGGLWLEGVAQ
ncbi:MAG: hypothetical protein Q9N68_05955 [Gammaproteobacteria bacterium]|nr:hypothetical protein [Gammaproteobacteria bacterium]